MSDRNSANNIKWYTNNSPISYCLLVAILGVLTACGGHGGAVTTPPPLPTLSVVSVSNNSPLALTPIYVGTSGLEMSAPVTIRFSNNSGFSITEQPIRVASDGTVVAATPLYVDPITGQTGPITASLVLSQGSTSSAPVTLSIQDLPTVSSYGAQPGQISRAVLVMEALLVGRRINQLQAFQFAPGNSVNNSQAQADLSTLLDSVIKARSDVDQVSQDSSAVVYNGTLPDGTSVQFDQVSLDLMDRVNAVFITQTLASLVPSKSVSSRSHFAVAPMRDRRLYASPQTHQFPLWTRTHQRESIESPSIDGATAGPSESHTSSSQIAPVLDLMETLEGASTISASSAAAANAEGLSDQALALVGGVASLGRVFNALPTTNANLLLGAIGAVVSDLRLVGDCWGDLGAYIFGLATHDQSLVNTAVDAMNSIDRVKLYSALGDLTLAFPELQAIEALQPVSTVLGLVETTHDIDTGLKNADSTTLAITNSFPVPTVDTQGIAFVTGNVDVPTNQGVFAPESGINLSSNGGSLSTIADVSGNYQAFVPLLAPPFTYGSFDVTIVDPISQTDLGSAVVDLSSLSTANPVQIPTIEGTPCLNTDFDGDDPDCD